MFRAPLCPSSGAHDLSVGYHIGRLFLDLLLVGILSADRMDEFPDRRLCGNHGYRREFLMMAIIAPETC